MMFLAFDLGTTNFKAAVFDDAGHLLALARRPTPVEHPAPGRAEIAQDVFRGTVAELVEDLRRQDGSLLGRVAAVSFASQANSFLLLDEADHALTPIILWNDRRAGDGGDTIAQLSADPGLHPETGLRRLGGLVMPAKWLWLRQHDPSITDRARRLCFISDELTRWFTGEHVAEAGAAALCGLVDIHRLAWRSDAVEAVGIGGVALPRIVRAGTDLGPMDAGVAASLGLPASCRFVVGCLDQYAGAIGAGNVQPGGLSETTGTVLATVRLAKGFAAPAPGVLQGPAFREGWYFRMCVDNVAANMLEAYRREHAPDVPYDALNEEAARVPKGCDGLSLDRVASNERGRPVFRGERPEHTRGHYVRAIFEAIAETLAEHVARLCPDARPPRILAAGGAARSELWRRIKGERGGIPVVATGCEEPTCRGAALLAIAATRGGIETLQSTA